MGHPWPIVPRLASLPNAPLHSTSTRPPDGTGGPRRLKVRGSGLDREKSAMGLLQAELVAAFLLPIVETGDSAVAGHLMDDLEVILFERVLHDVLA